MAKSKLKPKMKDMGHKPEQPVAYKERKWYPHIEMDAEDFPDVQAGHLGKMMKVEAHVKVMGISMREENGKMKTNISAELHKMGMMPMKKEPPTSKRRGHGIDNLEKAEY